MRYIANKRGAAMLIVVSFTALLGCLLAVGTTTFFILQNQRNRTIKELDRMYLLDQVAEDFVGFMDGKNDFIPASAKYKAGEAKRVNGVNYSTFTYDGKTYLYRQATTSLRIYNEKAEVLLIVEVQKDSYGNYQVINWSTNELS